VQIRPNKGVVQPQCSGEFALPLKPQGSSSSQRMGAGRAWGCAKPRKHNRVHALCVEV